MFKIIFYRNQNGKSDIENYINELHIKSTHSKEAKINFIKIVAYINELSKHGINLGMPYIKHIEGKIWELRPLRNRFFFAYYTKDCFILLHHFIKKSQKTPKSEIVKAKKLLEDYMNRRN